MKKYVVFLTIAILLIQSGYIEAQAIPSHLDTVGVQAGISVRSSYGPLAKNFIPTSGDQNLFTMSMRFGGFFTRTYHRSTVSGYILPEISRDITRDTFGEKYGDTTRFMKKRFVPVYTCLDYTRQISDYAKVTIGMTRTLSGFNVPSRLELDNQMNYELSRWIDQEALGATFVWYGAGIGVYYEPYSKNILYQMRLATEQYGVAVSYSTNRVASLNAKYTGKKISAYGYIDSQKKIAWHTDVEVIPDWRIHLFSNGSTGNGRLRSCTLGSYIVIVNNAFMRDFSLGTYYDFGGTHRNFALQFRLLVPITK